MLPPYVLFLSHAADHPLDQLTPAEITRASAAVKRYAAAEGITGTLRFNTVMLKEPPKAQLLAYQQGKGPKPERRAVVWLLNPPKGDLYEAIVSLHEGAAAAAKDVVRVWNKVGSHICQPSQSVCRLCSSGRSANTRCLCHSTNRLDHDTSSVHHWQ